jgi:hypothetical protein
MTRVNWELLSGEQVEEFVSALLLLRHQGPGNRITPSQGDRGVDVRLWEPDGFDFYQVKRYTSPLTSAQEREVERSWNTFVRDTVPTQPVKSWTLVCPWNPTNERLDWLRGLTANVSFPTHWMGRATLEALAAENPALVEYYFGDGGERLHRLLTNAFRCGDPLPRGVPAEDLLDSITARMVALSTALNDVDPFYRYEIEIRVGRVSDEPMEVALLTPTNAALMQSKQLDETHFQVMRIIPRHPAALELRPITSHITLDVTTRSAEHEAVQDFLHFGAPLHGIPGTVDAVTGPPGIHQPTGDGTFTILAQPAAAELPDLELRLVDADGETLHTLDLVDVRVARGAAGAGMWISATDRSGSLVVTFLMKGPDGQDEVRIEPRPVAGKTPAEVLPALRLKAGITTGTGLLLAVRGGPPLTTTWQVHGPEPGTGPQSYLGLVEALLEIQRHTLTRVVIPDVETTSQADLAEIVRTARLLRGEQMEVTWTEVSLTVGDTEELPPADMTEVMLMAAHPLTIELNGQTVNLDMERRIYYRSARLAQPSMARASRAGDQVRLVPGSNNTAIVVAVPATTA